VRSVGHLLRRIEEWEITWKTVDDRKAAARAKADVLQYLLSIRPYEFTVNFRIQILRILKILSFYNSL
jgi:hypothetical protein